jgi:hypothetical protein
MNMLRRRIPHFCQETPEFQVSLFPVDRVSPRFVLLPQVIYETGHQGLMPPP